jgi:hypothetical protein
MDDDSEGLYLVDHDRTTCATCRNRRGESMVCAACQTAFVPGEDVMLCYTNQETPPHRGILHARCTRDEATDTTFIYY